jgi:tRNA A-37 threonylcarbamoyl transferase component Bud32
MLKQGFMSTVEVIGDRIFKTIDKINVEGTVIPLYEEYKILKYVQTLGPEFPQNVKCERPLALSYDYIKGVTLEFYLENHQPSLKLQKNLGLQYILIYSKLMDKGIHHEDYNNRNIIMDENNMLHIIDFGIVWIYGQDKIGIDQESLPIDANLNDYPEPLEDYVDVESYKSNKENLDTIKRLIRYNLTYKDGLIKDIELANQLNKSKNLQEIIDALS